MERLSVEEQQRFWKAIDAFEDTQQKLSEIYTVIVGNERFGQEGLVSRLIKLESEVEKIQSEMLRTKGFLAGALFIGSIVGSAATLFIKYLIGKI
jgi:hypothetical protein